MPQAWDEHDQRTLLLDCGRRGCGRVALRPAWHQPTRDCGRRAIAERPAPADDAADEEPRADEERHNAACRPRPVAPPTENRTGGVLNDGQ